MTLILRTIPILLAVVFLGAACTSEPVPDPLATPQTIVETTGDARTVSTDADELVVGDVDHVTRESSGTLTDQPGDAQPMPTELAKEQQKAVTTVRVDASEVAIVEPPLRVTQSFTLLARQFSFEPSLVRVNVGDTVRLTIQSEDVEHGFSLPAYGISKTLASGQTVTVEFVADRKGTFPFFCSVFCGADHGRMNGTLIVE